MHNITKIIEKKAGKGNVCRWIEEEFGLHRSTFYYKIHNGTLKYREIVRLLDMLDIKFEDLNHMNERSYEILKPAWKKKHEKKMEIRDALPKPEKLSVIFGKKKK